MPLQKEADPPDDGPCLSGACPGNHEVPDIISDDCIPLRLIGFEIVNE